MDEDESKSKCVLCGREGALALFGILLGAAFLYMSVDVLMNGRLTAAITRTSLVEDSDD